MPEESVYDQSFFDEIDQVSRVAARRIAPVLLDLVPAKSAVDVGGGRGVWGSVLKEFGLTDVLVVDGDYVDTEHLAVAREEFRAHDLEKPLSLDRRADLAISLETAEHLSERRADSFVADLCRIAPVVLFSAAIPRQGGTNHINEQPQSYWAAKFAAQGYRASDAIRQSLWDDTTAGVVYLQNALIYANEEALARYPKLRESVERTNLRTLDVVHPHILRTAQGMSEEQETDLRRLLKLLPKAFVRAGHRAGGKVLRAVGLRKG